MSIKIGTNRVIPSGTPFWSICNQEMITMSNDLTIQITSTCCGNDFVFAKPMQLIFNMVGFIPTLIGKGTDEISISYSDTIGFELPKPTFVSMMPPIITDASNEEIIESMPPYMKDFKFKAPDINAPEISYSLSDLYSSLIDIYLCWDEENEKGISEGKEQLSYLLESLQKLLGKSK